MQWKPGVTLEMQHSILQITTWTERGKIPGLVWNQQRRKRMPSEAKAGSIYQLALRKDLYCQARSPQTELRQMKDKWWQLKAAELEQYSDVHNFKRFFEGLKTVYCPSSNAMAPVPSSDRTLLTGKSDIVQSWCKIFSQLLNRSTSEPSKICFSARF